MTRPYALPSSDKDIPRLETRVKAPVAIPTFANIMICPARTIRIGAACLLCRSCLDCSRSMLGLAGLLAR